MAQTTDAAPSPRIFRPTDTFRNGPAVFLVVGLTATVILMATRHYPLVPPLAAFSIAFLLLTLTARSLQIRMDADGVTRRWLWGSKTVLWHTVGRVEKTRRVLFLPGSVFLLDENGKELLVVAALPSANQQALVDEAVKRGRLRRDKNKPKPPIQERWVRR